MFEDYFIPFIVLLIICFFNAVESSHKRREKEYKEIRERLNRDKQ